MKDLKSLLDAICTEMHIDEEDIRLRKMHLGLTAEEEARLRDVHDRLEDFRGRFLDELYDGFMRFPPTAALLGDEAQMRRLKQSQGRYFDSLTGGNYGWDYIRNRLLVGAVHHHVGLDTKWYLGAYSKYVIALLHYLGEIFDPATPQYRDVMAALIKIIFLDMGLAMDAYLHAGRMNEAALRAYSESLVANTPCGMLVLAQDLRVISANPAARRLLQLYEDVEGLALDSFFPVDEVRQLSQAAWQDGHASCNIFLPFAGGETRNLLVSFARLSPIEDGRGEPLNEAALLMTIEDFTQLWRASSEMARMSNYDDLTGLPNRRLFQELAQHAIGRARQRSGRLAILFLDLNRFKDINDTLGHAAGDALLQTVALRLKGVLRRNDVVSHFGGDRFTILLQGLYDRQDCIQAIHKIQHVFASPYVVADRELFLSANIGVSFFPHDGEDPQSLLKYADAALHRSKEQGTGAYCFFRSGMDNNARQALSLTTELRQALEQHQFCLHYQPIIDLDAGRIASVEALLRWRRPDGELVPPLQFLPHLEESGLIKEVGDWVLLEACTLAGGAGHEASHPLAVSVNVSSVQLNDPEFSQRVFHILARTGLDPGRLELELTESMLIERTGVTADNINCLAEMGVRLAIDDFGIGYSSLAYLKRFPLHTLKIDRSFIQDICEDGQGAAVARTIVSLGRALSLRVVAEGVETPAQLQLLKRWGCSAVQGYLLCRPVGHRALEPLLGRDWLAVCATLPGGGPATGSFSGVTDPEESRR